MLYQGAWGQAPFCYMWLKHLFESVHDFIYQEIFPHQMWSDAVIAVDASKELNSKMVYGALLPALTFGSVGGCVEQAIPLAAAWVLYDLASDIFDDIQDGDDKNRPWVQWPKARAMNVGIQMIGGAQQCLSLIEGRDAARREIIEVWANVLKTAARNQNNMMSGLQASNSLEQYLEQTAAKSGGIFACVARAGARLKTEDQFILNIFNTYGFSVGMMIQILDDCRDLASEFAQSDVKNGIYTLPILYSLSQTLNPLRSQLENLLADAAANRSIDNIQDICRIVTEMGGFDHCFYMNHSYRLKAMSVVQNLSDGVYKDALGEYLMKLDPIS